MSYCMNKFDHDFRVDMFRILLGIVSCILLVGCSSLDEFSSRNNISPEEFAKMVNNARNYAISKEKSLNTRDIEIINSVEPTFSVYYVGPKSGQFGLKWRITEGRLLLVDGMGYLTEKESLSGVSIKFIPGVGNTTK